jgi:hypothetical protein
VESPIHSCGVDRIPTQCAVLAAINQLKYGSVLLQPHALITIINGHIALSTLPIITIDWVWPITLNAFIALLIVIRVNIDAMLKDIQSVLFFIKLR